MSRTLQIDQVRAIFTPDNLLATKPISENFYAELDDDFGDFSGHILVSQHAFSEPWPTWEIHPEGDELVMLIAGDTDMVLAHEDGAETVMRVSEPGEYVIIPKASWHTARPHAPTTMLFLTPGQGTINALKPFGEPVT